MLMINSLPCSSNLYTSLISQNFANALKYLFIVYSTFLFLAVFMYGLRTHSISASVISTVPSLISNTK